MNLEGDGSVKRSCLAKQYFHEHNFVNFHLQQGWIFATFSKSRPKRAISALTSFLQSFLLCHNPERKKRNELSRNQNCQKPPGLRFHEVIHLNKSDPLAVSENPGFILRIS